ncbi:Zuotin [Candida viswanathii]|uniref:Zuotin n=1 Tax=Candida viswanathii TaxID=5486 RepID=A0A367XZ29_9ASCO|nr:Zuotin [Candida viswanathii]
MSIVLPSGTTDGFHATGKYSSPVRRPIEPVGRYFLAHALRTLRGHTWSEFEKLEAEKNVKQIESSEDDDLGDEEQSAELLEHDPREWKTANLYAVLGLSHLRSKATEDQIRRAHRKQVLKHHPDKKSAAGGLENDGFFKIIQKAFEVMLDPVKRKQYDSVDVENDPQPPAAKSEYDFFEAWGPVFESEARFSTKQPVPLLGNLESSKEEVDAFYHFWGRFDSWKTFEFKDEDVPDDTANRDHKRYIERKNIANRKKLKQEDNKRIIEIVERAHADDPRIKLFKEQAKKEKAAKKWEKEAGSRKAAEEAAAKKAARKKPQRKPLKKLLSLRLAPRRLKKLLRPLRRRTRELLEVLLRITKFDDVKLGEVAAKVKDADAAAIKEALTESAKELIVAGSLDASYLKYFN